MSRNIQSLKVIAKFNDSSYLNGELGGWLSWIWWVKCILRYSPAGEGVEGTTPDTGDTKIDRFYSK
ncbi:MAG: hypothetical protein ACKO7A_16155, partial [Microcystis sp.]